MKIVRVGEVTIIAMSNEFARALSDAMVVAADAENMGVIRSIARIVSPDDKLSPDESLANLRGALEELGYDLDDESYPYTRLYKLLSK